MIPSWAPEFCCWNGFFNYSNGQLNYRAATHEFPYEPWTNGPSVFEIMALRRITQLSLFGGLAHPIRLSKRKPWNLDVCRGYLPFKKPSFITKGDNFRHFEANRLHSTQHFWIFRKFAATIRFASVSMFGGSRFRFPRLCRPAYHPALFLI